MCQEDNENKISKECLRNMVDDAIKTKNICIIERSEKENLRYVQKYIDYLISNKGLDVSIHAFDFGIYGWVFGIIAIGVSFYVPGYLEDHPASRTAFENQGAFIVFIAFLALLVVKYWYDKYFKKINKDIKFMQDLVLRIEELLEK